MIWVDQEAFDLKPAKKIPTVYACDCKNPKKKKYTSDNAGVFYITQVNSKGLCIHCRYYAVNMSTIQLNNNNLIRRSKTKRRVR